MIALDLFCGAGGASMGLHQSGLFAEIIGVDINPQPNYPFTFIQEDAIEFCNMGLDCFDVIWASPPCQAYSVATAKARNAGKKYPDLIPIVREKLLAAGKPFIIENVPGAPLNNPVMLSGTMFDNLKVIRRRVFECFPRFSVDLEERSAGIKVKAKRNDNGTFFSVAGNNIGTTYEWRDAMGIDWMTRHELTQAIPPAYSKYLVEKLWQATKL